MCSDVFHRVVMLGLSKTRRLVSSFHVEIIFYYINLYYIILLGRDGASGHHTAIPYENSMIKNKSARISLKFGTNVPYRK